MQPVVSTTSTRLLPSQSTIKIDCSVIKKIVVIALKVIFSAILIHLNQTLFCTGVLFSVLLPNNSIRYLEKISAAAKSLSFTSAAIAAAGTFLAVPFAVNTICFFSGASIGLELMDYSLKESDKLQEELWQG